MIRPLAWLPLSLLCLVAAPAAADDVQGLAHPAPPHHPLATFATHDTDPQPTISITAPVMDARLPVDTPVQLTVDLQGLVLGPDGYHVHVWVDDKPYQAMYDATVPFPLTGLEPGWHSIRVAPSRPWHELFKNAGAFAWVNIQIGESEHVWSKIDGSKPILTYSRPKKNLEHTWAASRNLIADWYVTGVTLGEDGVYARLTLNGMSYLLTSWAPIFVEHPFPGEHRMSLELLRDGELVDANFNPFTASYTVLEKDEAAIVPASHH